MVPVRRRKVSKRRSVRQFRRTIGRTQAANFVGLARGGLRL